MAPQASRIIDKMPFQYLLEAFFWHQTSVRVPGVLRLRHFGGIVLAEIDSAAWSRLGYALVSRLRGGASAVSALL